MQESTLLSKLESSMPFLSNAEQSLGRFILDHPNDILTMSTKELSQNSGVSEATLIRFTRKLGLNGYTEFKLQLSADLASNERQGIPVDVTEEDHPLEIYKKLALFTATSIDATSQTLTEDDLTAAVELISNTYQTGHRIYISGMGGTSVVAKELQIKLMRLDIPSIFFEDVHLQLEAISNMKKDDLLICFTALAKSAQNHQYIHIANERSGKVLLITQFGNQRLAEKATITLYTSCIENNFRLTSQTSIIVQSIIIDTLFLSLALKNLPKILQEVEDARTVFTNFGYYDTPSLS
ncbi:MAG: MurR/RpiR family transcriptional regulator [Lachnospiraceae bacterium]|nr:MurR/RpiR family transcriptional regulator [Lachnospiraceae bacterium]